ncbi:hypothetical protein Dimus_038758 [Dionaea muscipula]
MLTQPLFFSYHTSLSFNQFFFFFHSSSPCSPLAAPSQPILEGVDDLVNQLQLLQMLYELLGTLGLVPESREQIEAHLQNRQEAAARREKAMATAFNHQTSWVMSYIYGKEIKLVQRSEESSDTTCR